MWYTRLGVRKFDNQGKFLGVDEDDDIRFTLTAEAGLNDGLAFPFVLLGLVVMTVNLMVDLTYGIINPRIRRAS